MTELATYPSYVELYASGELERRVEEAHQRLADCTLCPVVCQANRLDGEVGVCGGGRLASLASYGTHFGEEHILRGWRGSGAVFFAGCNMHCVYCQNADISQDRQSAEVTPDMLAAVFLDLQQQGCHNLNLVTPSHVIPQILEALLLAAAQGLRLPIVYNSSAYDALPALRLLDGIVDIYMPDLKYADSTIALRYSGINAYWEVARRAVAEMHRQVGDLRIEGGIARRGLLIRHLVLPNDLAGTAAVMQWIATLSLDSWVNLMDQYRPAFYANRFPKLQRPITGQEYAKAIQSARAAGVHRGIPFERPRLTNDFIG